MRCGGGKYDKDRVMNVGILHGSEASIGVINRRRRIRKKHHLVFAKHSITRCRMAAIFCGRSRYDDSVDAPLTQNYIQFRAKETAVADAAPGDCIGDSG
jgi:hypothetical protein